MPWHIGIDQCAPLFAPCLLGCPCILIPCHRVVGATSSIVGYAGGLDRKGALLEIEHSGALRAGLARREKEQLMSIEENKAAVRRW